MAQILKVKPWLWLHLKSFYPFLAARVVECWLIKEEERTDRDWVNVHSMWVYMMCYWNLAQNEQRFPKIVG